MINFLICTNGNFKNLRKCLLSINNLNYNYNIKIILIDNNPKLNTKNRIKKIFLKKNISLILSEELRRGIPYARNKSLNISKKNKSIFTAFIDDDCIVPKDWLKQMLKTIYEKKAQIITGPQIPLSKNLYEQALVRKCKHRSYVKWAATNNFFMKYNILNNKKLYFDQNLNKGGSDQLFFLKLSKANKIVWNNKARVFELPNTKRTNIKWFLLRNIRYGSTSSYIYKTIYGSNYGNIICLFKFCY
jgi:succinoglycan biosynthesis protein ExoM